MNIKYVHTYSNGPNLPRSFEPGPKPTEPCSNSTDTGPASTDQVNRTRPQGNYIYTYIHTYTWHPGAKSIQPLDGGTRDGSLLRWPAHVLLVPRALLRHVLQERNFAQAASDVRHCADQATGGRAGGRPAGGPEPSCQGCRAHTRSQHTYIC